MAGPSVGRVWFELFLPLPMAAGVSMLGVAVLVSAWATGAVPALAGRAVHLVPLVGTGGENAGSYG